MKLGKGDRGAKGGPGAQPGDKGQGLASFWISGFLGVALPALAGIGLLVWIHLDREAAVQAERLGAEARALSQRLSQTLGVYHGLLDGLAADPETARAFAAGGAALAERERVLSRLLPDLLRVRLLPPGHDRPDPEQPSLGFAGLTLLRTAEHGDRAPPLEVHRSGAAEPYLAGAALVRGPGGEPVGLMHLAFSAAPLGRWLAEIGPVAGRIELQQQVEGESAALFANPGAPLVSAPPDGITPVAHSLLRVAWWLSPADRPGSDFLLWGAMALLIVLVAGGLLVYLQYRRLHKALDSDYGLVVLLVDDTLAGRAAGRRPAPRLRGFQPVLELLGQRMKAAQRASRAQDAGGMPAAAPTAAPQGAQGRRQAAQAPAVPEVVVPPAAASGELPDLIFRAYDIRGLVGEHINPPVVREIGRAVGSQAYDLGQQTVIVGRDARESGKELSRALIEGLNVTGRDVIDLGVVPVPVVYFATHFLGSNCGVMVTGSHNPAEYNGLKIVLGGESLGGEALHGLRERAERGDLLEGSGAVHAQDLLPDYIERVADDVRVARPLKVVLDCGGGAASLVAPSLFSALGCEVVTLRCELDPGVSLDPSRPDQMRELQQAVLAEKAELGLAFDGDGDRIGVVDSRGHVIFADRVLMLLSADVLSRHPGGDVVFDVKCSRALGSQILQHGGRPVMWKSGHTLLKAKLKETGALLAGEWSGHIIFKERWYGFDDAFYAGARLLEILSVDPRDSAEVFADLPEFVSTPELLLPMAEGEPRALMDQVKRNLGALGGGKISTIDGVRVELEDGWGLVRASNTSPAVSFRFEADTEEALERIQSMFRALMEETRPGLELPF